jgi:hypothetical protein
MELDINDYVDAAIDDEGPKRRQMTDAAAIIAQFIVVREGLAGRISAEDINATAATLTAAIWANSK